MPSTKSSQYASRLQSIQGKRWKKALSVVNPYKWHIKQVMRAPALEVGCGIGRVLKFAPTEITGVDHNQAAIDYCLESGLHAYSTESFFGDPENSKKYQSIIISHVLEHMNYAEALDLINTYLPMLATGGRVIIACPQEVGYKSDETHVEFMDFKQIHALCAECGLEIKRSYSFPFPRPVGRLFIYNEFIVVAEKP